MKSINAPRNTEKVLPQPVGAFTSPELPAMICSQVSSWKAKGWRLSVDIHCMIVLYPGDSFNIIFALKRFQVFDDGPPFLTGELITESMAIITIACQRSIVSGCAFWSILAGVLPSYLVIVILGGIEIP